MKRRVFGVVAAGTAFLALAALSSVAAAGNPHGTPPGQEKADVSASSSSSQTSATTTSDNSTGVKPSNTTQHDTYAPASSNRTKLYGNGKTAGQIAAQAGYGDATLHGPGNSQPHKVLCGPHEVDVHALKAKGDTCGASSSSTGGCGTPSCSSSHTSSVSSSHTSSNTASSASSSTTSNTGSSGNAGATASAGSPATATSGVLGARATLRSPTTSAAPRSGVLGATARTSQLPFTGLPLWIPALAAFALLGTGSALRRRAGSQI